MRHQTWRHGPRSAVTLPRQISPFQDMIGTVISGASHLVIGGTGGGPRPTTAGRTARDRELEVQDNCQSCDVVVRACARPVVDIWPGRFRPGCRTVWRRTGRPLAAASFRLADRFHVDRDGRPGPLIPARSLFATKEKQLFVPIPPIARSCRSDGGGSLSAPGTSSRAARVAWDWRSLVLALFSPFFG